MITDTMESLVRFAQNRITEQLKSTEDKTIAISCSGLFRTWEPGTYKAGDIRTDDGKPYECMQDHDSVTNPDWTIKIRTLWKPYHSRRKEWALPWEQPTGAHDMYKTGEYMIYTDGNTYLCEQDTNFSPKEYPQAWKVV